MGQRAQRDYSRMQLAELSGRMRRLDNLRSLNNPWMLGGPRVSSLLVRETFLSYGSERRKNASPSPLRPSKSPLARMLQRS